MSKTYHAILIDTEARSITELQTDASLASIHQLIGTDTLDHARMVTYNDGGLDYGWVADDGLTGGKPVHAFLLPTGKYPLAGRCLIIGSDRYGETCSSRLPLAPNGTPVRPAAPTRVVSVASAGLELFTMQRRCSSAPASSAASYRQMAIAEDNSVTSSDSSEEISKRSAAT